MLLSQTDFTLISPCDSTLSLCASLLCKHFHDFNSLQFSASDFRSLLCDLYSAAFFPGCSTNLLTLEGFVWKKQVKNYLNIIAVWPVGLLDVATLSGRLSTELMKAHKHKKCGREQGNLRPLQFALSSDLLMEFVWFCVSSSLEFELLKCGLERSCAMWAWDFPKQMINRPFEKLLIVLLCQSKYNKI